MSLQTRLAGLIGAIGADIKSLDLRTATPCVRVITETTLALSIDAIESHLDNNDRVLATNETNKANNGVYVYSGGEFVKEFSEVYKPGRIFPVVHKVKLGVDRDYDDPALWVCTSAEPTGGFGAQDGILFELISGEAAGPDRASGAMELIGEFTTASPGSSPTTIAVQDIPQGFRDLRVVVLSHADRASIAWTSLRMRMNDIASVNAYYNNYDGYQGAAELKGTNNYTSWFIGQTPGATRGNDNYVSMHVLDILFYSRPDVIKTFTGHEVGGEGFNATQTGLRVAGFNNTTANPITKLTFFEDALSNFGPRARVLVYGIRDTVGSEPLPAAARARKTSNIVGLLGSSTIEFDTTVFESVPSMHGTGTAAERQRLVAPESGYYYVHGRIRWNSGGSNGSERNMTIFRGSDNFVVGFGGTGQDAGWGTSNNPSGLVWLNKGDYIYATIYSQETANANAGQDAPMLEMFRVQGLSDYPIIPRITTQAELTAISNGAKHGQEIDLVLDAVNGIVCRAKYNATSASPYKWEVVGGAGQIRLEEAAALSTTSTSYIAGGGSLTIPFSGDWDVEFGGYCYGDNSTSRNTLMKPGTSAPSDGLNALVWYVTSLLGQAPGYRTIRLPGLAAAATLRNYFRTISNTSTWENRILAARPVRVG